MTNPVPTPKKKRDVKYGPITLWRSGNSLWGTLWLWHLHVRFGVGLPLTFGVRFPSGTGNKGVIFDLGLVTIGFVYSGSPRVSEREASWCGYVLSHYAKQIDGQLHRKRTAPRRHRRPLSPRRRFGRRAARLRRRPGDQGPAAAARGLPPIRTRLKQVNPSRAARLCHCQPSP